MKYSLVLPGKTIPEHIKSALEEQPARSGCYNWIFAFQGEINTFDQIRDRLGDYDIVQVNMSPVDMPLIAELRRLIDSQKLNTKLVVNNDYVCEFWDQWHLNPLVFKQYQRMGDMVFGTEPYQTSQLIEGSFCIPHPTNTEVLKHLGHDYTKKEDSVGFIYHWWARQAYLAHLTLEKVKKNYKVKKSRMFGYGSFYQDQYPMNQYVKMMFDEISDLEQFPDFADAIQKTRCLYDPNPFHTYGRNGVEAACLGVPVVGSNRVFSYRLLFPELSCDPFDSEETMKRFDIVLNPERKEELAKIMKEAYEKVDYFNYENSKKRYLDALKTAVERGGSKWYMEHGE